MKHVVGPAVEPVAISVLVGAEVDLPPARLLAVHSDVVGHRLVEPGGPLVQLFVILGPLVPRRDRREVPVHPVDVVGTVDALVKVQRLRHRLADERRLGEDPGLALVGFERAALLDAERPQHRHEEPVAFGNRLGVHALGQSFPIRHTPRLRRQPRD